MPTTKTAEKKSDRTPVTSVRLTAVTTRRLERIEQELECGRAGAIEASVTLAMQTLGLAEQDVVAALAELERRFGPDRQVVGVVVEEPGDSDGLAVGAVRAMLDPNTPLDGWTGALLVKHSQETVFCEVLLKHVASDVAFDLGTLRDPQPGTGLAVRVADLPGLALPGFEASDPRELRRELGDARAMARKLFPPSETEEAPLTDDDA
jgi:hypothetical protein